MSVSKKIVKKLIKTHKIKSGYLYRKKRSQIDDDLKTASRLVTIISSDQKKIPFKNIAERLKYPMTFCSIDPGNTAMGLRIEKIRSKSSTTVSEFSIASLDKSSDVYESDVIKFLYKHKIFTCDVIVIEKQLALNKDMQRLEQIIKTSWLTYHHFRSSTDIRYFVSVSSTLKTKLMINNYEDKKTVTYHVARDILYKMRDVSSQKILDEYREDISTNKKKRSDLSDTVCQLYAFLYAIGHVKLFK